MYHRRNRALSVILVVLALALVAGAIWLLVSSLPQRRDKTVDTLDTNSVFENESPAAAPERETPFAGERPEIPTEGGDAATDAPLDEQTPEGETVPPSAGLSAQAQALCDEVFASMTPEEKLWQLFFVTPESLTGVETATRAGETTKKALEEKPVGGIVFFSKNLEDREQTAQMLANAASYSRHGVFLATDEEGGTVSRLGANPALGVETVGAMRDYGDAADPAAVYEVGQTVAGSLQSLGFNMNFAPVADVAASANAVIGSRSFGTDAQLCASLVRVMAGSLRDGGVIPCVKHFPGYGSATADDHLGAASVTKTLEEMEACDFLPFRAAIEDGVPFVMVSHLSAPEVTGDETPSDLSSVIVTDLLRNKLGFGNVIITDSQQMGSITDSYTPGDAAVQALAAGVDMILMPDDLDAAYDAVQRAVSDGILTQQRIDESVRRILQVKAAYGILRTDAPDAENETGN